MAPPILLKKALAVPPPTETTKRLSLLLDGKSEKKHSKKPRKPVFRSSDASTDRTEPPQFRKRTPAGYDRPMNKASSAREISKSSNSLPVISLKQVRKAKRKISQQQQTCNIQKPEQPSKSTGKRPYLTSEATCNENTDRQVPNREQPSHALAAKLSRNKTEGSTDASLSIGLNVSAPVRCPPRKAPRIQSRKDRHQFLSEDYVESKLLPPMKSVESNTLEDNNTDNKNNTLEIHSLQNKLSSDPLPRHAPSPISKFQPENLPRPAATASVPAKKRSQGNFVRLNLRNAAGACRGARNKKAKSKFALRKEQRQEEWKQKQKERVENRGVVDIKCTVISNSGIDPVDDYVDGAFLSKKQKRRNNVLPHCSVHQRPCKLLTVRKSTSENKGRQFYCCSLPREEQCNFFVWADDTTEATRNALLKNSSQTGFIARQVTSFMERVKCLTVPELKDLVKKHGLNSAGSKKHLLARMQIWVRDELKLSLAEQDDAQSVHDSTDEDSGEEEELELFESQPESSLEMSEDTDEEFSEDDNGVSDEVEDPKSVDAEKTQCPIRAKLRTLFGHHDFRHGQEWAIRRCLESKRTLLVAPTGYGKSVCYALPAALLSGICIVVSPLLSLIQDQLRILPPRLPSVTLSGQLSTAKIAATLDDICRGRIKVLFVSPERLASPSFRRMFRTRWNKETKQYERQFPAVSLLCVDEAHCLSQWGHNFRPSYLRMRSMLQLVQPKSVLAITATAGPKVVGDICEALEIRQQENIPDSGVMVMSTNRDNIDVKSFIMNSHEERLNKLLKILLPRSGVSSDKEGDRDDSVEGSLSTGSVIVYVWRQRDAEAVAEHIQEAGVDGGVVVYHAGMESAARTRSQGKFIRGKARICVATVAFGLGINKADVAGVVHMYLSASTEHFLQEIGRAGRDGRQALAVSLVLQDEVLVRNSLSHSDLLAQSQVSAILETLSLRTKSLLSKLGERPDYEPVNLSINLHETCIACDVKAESIETVVSLLEKAGKDSLLAVEGTSYDRVTLAPKRSRLDQLSKKEPVAAAILACSTCVEAPFGDISTTESNIDNPFADSTFGCYSFSVSDCSNFLGATAEPRNVFAALRRLESNGDIVYSLDTSQKGRSLNMRLTQLGMSRLRLDRDPTLAEQLHGQFSQTITANCRKVIDLHYLLREVAQTSSNREQSESASGKSASLIKFQELVSSYFDCEGHDRRLADRKGIKSDIFGKLPFVSKLSNDVLAVISFLREAQQSLEGAKLLHIGHGENADYTALAATKFLHGIAPATLSIQLLRQHALFGTLRDVQFSELRAAVAKVLTP